MIWAVNNAHNFEYYTADLSLNLRVNRCLPVYLWAKLSKQDLSAGNRHVLNQNRASGFATAGNGVGTDRHDLGEHIF